MRSIRTHTHTTSPWHNFSVLHQTPMESLEHHTDNVPTKWESISLIWPDPKYSHSQFFVQNKLKLVDGGSDGGQLGREHRKQ